MQRESYGDYEFLIYLQKTGWGYIVFKEKNLEIKSDDYFETKEEARFAAIGHINLLETEKAYV